MAHEDDLSTVAQMAATIFASLPVGSSMRGNKEQLADEAWRIFDAVKNIQQGRINAVTQKQLDELKGVMGKGAG